MIAICITTLFIHFIWCDHIIPLQKHSAFISISRNTKCNDVRLLLESSKIGKEIFEKFTTQQDLIHSVQLIEAIGEEVVVGIKSRAVNNMEHFNNSVVFCLMF